MRTRVDRTATPPPTDEPRPGPTRLDRGELLAIAGFWLFMAALTAANRLLDPRRPSFQPIAPSIPIGLALFESLIWASLTPFIVGLSRRFTLDRDRALRVLALVGAGLLTAIFVDFVLDLARAQLLPPPTRARPTGFARLWVSTGRLWFLDELVVYTAILAAGYARDYSLRYRARREESVRLQAETARLQAQLAEARLASLRTQLNPHFLFNTLHAVSALVERDPKGVRRMIARLSELLRHSLDAAEQEVTLEREIDFVRRYLEIIQIRFQGRVEVKIDAPPDAMEALVPTLILQPLVENAIKHGVSRLPEGGRVEVAARRDNGRLILTVRDDGPPPEADASAATEGVGLRITRERLEQLYGEEQSLALRPADGRGMEAEVTLPYHTPADLRAAGVPAGG